MYASPALTLHSKQISELNYCWHNVKGVIYGLGRLNVAFEFLVRRVKFYKYLYFKYGFIHDIFWAVLLSDNRDDCMRSVFIPLHKSIDDVYSQFF